MPSELENKEGKAAVGEVPGALRFGWMLLAQPIKLQKMFEIAGEAKPALSRLWHKARREEDLWARTVLKSSCLVALAWFPLVVVPCTGALYALGADVSWPKVCAGVLLGIAVAGAASLGDVTQALRLGLAVSLGFSLFGAVEVRGASAVGVAVFGVVAATALRLFMSSAVAKTQAPTTSARVGETGVLALVVVIAPLGRACGAGASLTAVVREDARLFTGMALLVSAVSLQIHTYLFECLVVLFIAAVVTVRPGLAPRLAQVLPFRHHDLIFFPLPGLRNFLVSLADQAPVLAMTLIDEAIGTVAQRTPAIRALNELRARSLEHAARERLWASAANFDLPFLPKPDDLPGGSPLVRFRDAAFDLQAAHLTTDHLRHRNALERARRTMEGLYFALANHRRPDDLERRLVAAARLWREAIDDALSTLAMREKANPQIPTPFEPGPPLRGEDWSLFKGRADLVQLIDHDLADCRRAPLFLTGQRRMGKTSLLHMLPARLGTGTRVVTLNFQSLSGHAHRACPHRWLAESILPHLVGAYREPPPPPSSDAWTDTLSWLRRLEHDQTLPRLLIAIDEIERLQTGIEEGWTTPAFLDFLRAAGDSLDRIRLLLVSAHPLHRLGHAWTDRLISVVHHEIGYLTQREAEDLVTRPTDSFPDIYPLGGVARIVAATRGHPYLVQLVCDALVRDLNGQSKLKADDADITHALDRALDRGSTPLRELWSDRNEAEHAILRHLAEEPASLGGRDPAARDLLHEGLIEKDGETYRVAVPLFATWIRERA